MLKLFIENTFTQPSLRVKFPLKGERATKNYILLRRKGVDLPCRYSANSSVLPVPPVKVVLSTISSPFPLQYLLPLVRTSSGSFLFSGCWNRTFYSTVQNIAFESHLKISLLGELRAGNATNKSEALPFIQLALKKVPSPRLERTPSFYSNPLYFTKKNQKLPQELEEDFFLTKIPTRKFLPNQAHFQLLLKEHLFQQIYNNTQKVKSLLKGRFANNYQVSSDKLKRKKWHFPAFFRFITYIKILNPVILKNCLILGLPSLIEFW